MKTYDIFFFDLDGTLVDSSEGITNAVMYALDKFGIKEENRENLYKFIGPPLMDSFRDFYGFSKEKSLQGVMYYREYYQDKGIYENTVYEGLKEVLETLKQAGKRLVVATSKPEPYARNIVEHFGLAPYFEYVAGMALDGERGTKSEVIDYALKTCKIEDKSKVLMIGDREHDVRGARKSGIDCLGILYGFGNYEELKTAGATHIEENVEDILKYAKIKLQ